LIFFVRSKLPKSELRNRAIPETICGIPTDVEEIGEVRFFLPVAAPSGQDRQVNVGAICIVSDSEPICGLTVAHAVVGTRVRSMVTKSTVPSGTQPNSCDAAIVRLCNGQAPLTEDFCHSDRENAAIPLHVTAGDLGLPVRKFAPTTGISLGTVVGVDAQIRIGEFEYINQLVLLGMPVFALPGDSGAIVLQQADSRPVGLLFAGSASGHICFANRIDVVMATLGIQQIFPREESLAAPSFHTPEGVDSELHCAPRQVEIRDTWSEEKNRRRCELVDKEIDGTITSDEQSELDELQAQMLGYRRKVAPLPLEDVRRLHQELLRRAGAQSASSQ
jgi:hypothetical protein